MKKGTHCESAHNVTVIDILIGVQIVCILVVSLQCYIVEIPTFTPVVLEPFVSTYSICTVLM